MSRLARQIQQCMSGLTEAGENELAARFLFPAGFIGFQGHFPDRPVLPAVCEIQAAVAMLEAWKKGRVRLKEIVLAKFASPVTSDEEVVLRCSITMEGEQEALVKADVAKKGDRVASFKLRVTFEHGTRGCS